MTEDDTQEKQIINTFQYIFTVEPKAEENIPNQKWPSEASSASAVLNRNVFPSFMFGEISQKNIC